MGKGRDNSNFGPDLDKKPDTGYSQQPEFLRANILLEGMVDLKRFYYLTALLFLIIITVYIGSIFILGSQEGRSFNQYAVFTPYKHDSLSAIVLKGLIVLSGMLFVVFIPGFSWLSVWKGEFEDYFNTVITSFVCGLIAMIFSLIVYKCLIPQPLNRMLLLGIAGGLFILGFITSILFRRKKGQMLKMPEVNKSHIHLLVITILFILGLIYVFRGKIFLENFDGDGYENFVIADSLKKHILPYSYLETQSTRFGYPVTCNPFFIDAHLNLFFILLFGPSEASIRLHYFLYLFLIAFLSYKFLQYKNEEQIQKKQVFYFLLLLLPLVLFTIIYFFYSGYNSYFTDVAADAVMDIMFMMFVFLQAFFLLKKKTALFLVFALFSALTLHTGVMFTIILLCLYGLFMGHDYKGLVKKAAFSYLTVMIALGSIIYLYGLYQGDVGDWWQMFKTEYINEYLGSVDILRLVLFLGYFAVICGGVPVLALFFPKKKDRLSFVLSLTALIYLIFISQYKGRNITYYIAPISIIPSIVYLRLASKTAKVIRGFLYLSYVLSICIIVVLIYPRGYKVNTHYRDIGKEFCLKFPNYEEAVKHIYSIADELEAIAPAQSPLEALGYYGNITENPAIDYDYYITNSNIPPRQGVKLLLSSYDSYLFGKDLEPLINPSIPKKVNYTNSFLFGELQKQWFKED